jgi:glycosyltransferase involved in cell wall biosynthesis
MSINDPQFSKKSTIKIKSLSILVPCFNEEDILPTSLGQLQDILESLIARSIVTPKSAIYCVDDGSRDRTWAIIESWARRTPLVHGIKLSRNCGHQRAIIAGMTTIPGDMIITIDADLQDDTAVMETMVGCHTAGAEIVYGVRNQRVSDSFFKRNTAQWYYRLLKGMGVEIIFNHADYRLMGRRSIEALLEYKEANLFVRGIIPHLGFTAATVEYARKPRLAGDSKYPTLKILSLAWEGITSFSILPLRLMFFLGLVLASFSFMAGVMAILIRCLTDSTIPGWTSIVVPMVFLGGLQLIAIGLMGEYIGKIYMETKSRPRFHIEKEI